MGGQYQVSELQKVVELGCEVGNVIHVMVNGGGVFALARLIDEATAMQGFDFELAKKQAAELDKEDLGNLNMAAKAKLDLANNKALEAKIEAGFDVVPDALALAELGFALVKKVKEIFS